MLSAAFRGLRASLGLHLWGRYYIGGGLESRNRNEIPDLPPVFFLHFSLCLPWLLVCVLPCFRG